MNANEILSVKDGEKPLDNLVTGGGFASIFRTIAVVGDSLSSGEFESQKGVSRLLRVLVGSVYGARPRLDRL